MKVYLGPGGTAGLGYEEAIPYIAKLGLCAMEVEFTYGVRMSNEQAKIVGQLAKQHKINLSVHGPYYINLASKEKQKIESSIKRILDSCERAHHLGASPVVYHSGFFQGQDPKKVKQMITENTLIIMDKIKEAGYNTKIAPELTGKPSQYGSIPELLDLKDDTGCNVTIDFAHQYARNQGMINYNEVFDQLSSLKHIHAHFSGIEYTAKGERNHILTDESVILPFVKEILKRKSNITIINESPDPIADSVKTKNLFERLNH